MGRRRGAKVRELRTEIKSLTRSACPQDIGTLVDLMAGFHAESGYILDRDAAAQSFKRLLENPQFGAAWLASVGEETAGYVVLTQRYSMDHGAFTAHMQWRCTDGSDLRHSPMAAFSSTAPPDLRESTS